MRGHRAWEQVALIGAGGFAQAELGDVVYVELPEVGATVTAGEGFGVVESVKVTARPALACWC